MKSRDVGDKQLFVAPISGSLVLSSLNESIARMMKSFLFIYSVDIQNYTCVIVQILKGKGKGEEKKAWGERYRQ